MGGLDVRDSEPVRFIIAEALDRDGATVDSVAKEIAASEPFLIAVRKGVEHQTADGGVPTRAHVMRIALSTAFGAPTAGQMHD